MLREVSEDPYTPRVGVVLRFGGVRGVYARTGFLQTMQRRRIPIAANVDFSVGGLEQQISGALLIVPKLPRVRIKDSYAGWDWYIV